MARLLVIALAAIAARATNDDSRADLYKKKEPHASVNNQLTELRLDADSKGELASASGDLAAATEHLKAELDFEHAEKLIGHIDKNTPPDVVKQQAQFRFQKLTNALVQKLKQRYLGGAAATSGGSEETEV